MKDIEPVAPLPEGGKQGEIGEEGDGSQGGQGGHGGRGGRGGIGLTGSKGDTGARGMRGPSGGDKGDTGLTGHTGRTGRDGVQGNAGQRGDIGLTGLTGSTGLTGQRGKTGTVQTRLDRYALMVVVVVTALSAIYFSLAAQHQLDDARKAQDGLDAAQARFAAQVDCQQQLVETTVGSLKARSSFAESQATVTLKLGQAQKRYLTVIGTPETTRDEMIAAFTAYRQALDFNIQASKEQLRIRELNPYPTFTALSKCKH